MPTMELSAMGNFNKQEILMVGDTFIRIFLAVINSGLKTTLVLSGNTSAENAALQINATGIIPDYICDSIIT